MKFIKNEILESGINTVYLGTINDTPTILIGVKNLPDEIEIKQDISLNKNEIQNINQSDIINLYYPASNEIIDSYKNKMKIVTETFKDYKEKVEPYINSILDLNTKWVRNILYYKMEMDRILFKNKKFIVIKNIGWETTNDFYLLVIPFEPIKNIRHLELSHKELLENMKKKALDVAKKYNYNESDLYFFFHYHPSCYHLHLHVCIINHKVLKFRIYRHVLLEDVLSDLEIIGKKVIKFEMCISNPIYKLLIPQ
jgi:m7GpppX diphosphatase